MRAAKVDGNQRSIVAALRAMGASVTSLHRVGEGCPDLVVGLKGRTYLVEVKAPKGRVLPSQAAWHGAWRGSPVVVIRSLDEAVAWLKGAA